MIGINTLNGSGSTTFSVGAAASESPTLSCVYGGNTVYAGASAEVTIVIGQRATSTALVTDVASTTLAGPVSLTATVSDASGVAWDVAGGKPAVSGSVEFFDGSTSLGSAAVNGSGVASLSASLPRAGSRSLHAVYAGDATYLTSTSSPVAVPVAQGASTTTLVTSPSSSTYGQSVTLTATVSGPGVTPGGTVTFADGGTTLGTGTLDGAGHATLTVASLPAGTRSLTASYDGDDNYLPSSGTASQEVAKAASNTALGVSPGTSTLGGSVTLTATVSGSGAVPSGTVTFFDGSTQLGTGTLNGSGEATLTVSTLPVGSHALSAVYGGDGDYLASTGSASHTVGRGASTTVLTTSPGGPRYGQAVTVTVTVAAVAPATVTAGGSVTITDTTAGTTLGTVTLDGAGRGTLVLNDVSVGSHALSAAYAGDGDLSGSTGTATLTVATGAAPGITLAISPQNPGPGESLVLTSVVTPTAPATKVPTGSVTFTEVGTGKVVGTATLTPVPLGAALWGSPAGGYPPNSAIATLTITAPAAGAHSYRASFAGVSSTYASVTGDTVVTVSVPQAPQAPQVPQVPNTPVTSTSGVGNLPTGGVAEGDLPYTGTQVLASTGAGAGLLLLGAGAVLASRRRRVTARGPRR